MAENRAIQRATAPDDELDGAKVAKLREVAPQKAPEAPVPASAAEPAPEPKTRRSGLRRLLLLLGPLAAIAGGSYVYLSGGRYVSTDNAYVKADKLNLATDVSGIVAEIAVEEGQSVEGGRILFRLDDEPYRIALAGAEAELGAVRNEIATQQAAYRQNLALIEQAKTDVAFYSSAYERQQDLMKRGVSTQAAYDQAKRDLDTARERVTVAERQAEAALAQLGGKADDPPENNPRFQQVRSQVDKAKRDLARTVVRAPMAGVVTNVKALQVGQYLPAAQPAFSLVATGHIWVEANPKETDLTFMKPGDAATVTIDTYPGREWRAKVLSLSPATGAEFSVLPAQNASGNWVKVVQRVPIRLEVEVPREGPTLRSGMSAHVEIDTGHTRTVAGVLRDLKHSAGF